MAVKIPQDAPMHLNVSGQVETECPTSSLPLSCVGTVPVEVPVHVTSPMMPTDAFPPALCVASVNPFEQLSAAGLVSPIPLVTLPFGVPVMVGRLESVASAAVTPEALASSAMEMAWQKRRRKKRGRNKVMPPDAKAGSEAPGNAAAADAHLRDDSTPPAAGPSSPESCSETCSPEDPELKTTRLNQAPPRLPSRDKRKRPAEVEPSERTLWDIIVLNKRVVSSEELAARKAAKLEAAKKLEESSAPLNALDSLLEQSDTASLFDPPTQTTAASTTDLFGSIDPLLSKSLDSATPLRFDAEGNFLLEDGASTVEQPSNDDGLFNLLEGRTVVDEDYSRAQPIQPYAKAYKTTRATCWTEADDAKFFGAIETFGLDFMMIQTMLPQFTLKQLRDKYKCEEKRTAGRIDAALSRRRPVTVEPYEALHGPIDVSTHFHPESGDDAADNKERLSSRQRNKSDAASAATLLALPKGQPSSQDDGFSSLFQDEVTATLASEDLSDLLGSRDAPDVPLETSMFETATDRRHRAEAHEGTQSLASLLGI